MADTNSKKTKLSGEAADPVLEQRVDAMMAKGRLAHPATAPEVAAAQPATTITSSAENAKAAGSETIAAESEVPTALEAAADPLVDDIVAHDGDELLAAHDARIAHLAATANSPQHGLKARLAGLLHAWWNNKWARYGTLAGLVISITALAIVPTSRYYAMNSVGIRSAASLTIIDNTNQRPLKNVSVTLGDRTAQTNQDGLVKLSSLRLGTQSLEISQPGFATISRTLTLGWGSNPLGDFKLNAVGTQFRFRLSDYLTGKAVKNAEISSGDSNAQADAQGQLVLTLGSFDSGKTQAKISADDYRTETVNLQLGQEQSQTIVMVPAQKEVYISKQSGKYDLYKVDVDGKNKQLLLAASGFEDADITVVQHAGDEAALVSNRDSQHNQDGYPLQALTLVDINTGSVLTLDHSERIQIVDWTHDCLIYVKIKAGTSAGNAERYQLMSYNYNTTSRLQLATANYFSDIVSAEGSIYYAASNNYQSGTSQFVKIKPDSTGKQVLIDKTDVWDVSRTAYDTLAMSVLGGSYSYKIGDPAAKKLPDALSGDSGGRFYLDNSDNSRAVWTDSRDGKGVLLIYNAATGKDSTLATQTGLNYPIRWLNAHTIVYRVATPAETADYAVSVDGGAAKKITDLTGTAGLGRWSYR